MYTLERYQHAGHSGTRYIISPGGSSAGSGVTNGEPCSTPVEGTTSRRNYRRPRAWHPGPKWHSFARLVLTARKSKLTERVALPPAVRVRYAVARWWGMHCKGWGEGSISNGRYQPHTLAAGRRILWKVTLSLDSARSSASPGMIANSIPIDRNQSTFQICFVTRR